MVHVIVFFDPILYIQCSTVTLSGLLLGCAIFAMGRADVLEANMQ